MSDQVSLKTFINKMGTLHTMSLRLSSKVGIDQGIQGSLFLFILQDLQQAWYLRYSLIWYHRPREDQMVQISAYVECPLTWVWTSSRVSKTSCHALLLVTKIKPQKPYVIVTWRTIYACLESGRWKKSRRSWIVRNSTGRENLGLIVQETSNISLSLVWFSNFRLFFSWLRQEIANSLTR